MAAIEIRKLGNVNPWPTRKKPQARFDTEVKAAMDQMSVMVGDLNGDFIPKVNAISLQVAQDSQAAAASASSANASKTAAANSASSAANSATSANASKTAAASSASSAADSKTAAANSASSAAASANSAAASKIAAAASASSAADSKTSAQASAAQAAQARDETTLMHREVVDIRAELLPLFAEIQREFAFVKRARLEMLILKDKMQDDVFAAKAWALHSQAASHVATAERCYIDSLKYEMHDDVFAAKAWALHAQAASRVAIAERYYIETLNA